MDNEKDLSGKADSDVCFHRTPPSIIKAFGTYPCLSCNSSFGNREDCREQVRDQAKNTNRKCLCCGKRHRKTKQLTEHQMADPTMCGITSADIQEDQHADSHCLPYTSQQQANNILREKCKECNFHTADKNEMVVHRFNEHIKPICVLPPGKKTFNKTWDKACTDCGEIFLSMANLNKHKKMHNTGKLLYSCSYCVYRSDFPRAIEKHLKKKHQGLQMIFKCALCDYVSVKMSALKTHITLDRHITG